jgi:hypothetical protein
MRQKGLPMVIFPAFGVPAGVFAGRGGGDLRQALFVAAIGPELALHEWNVVSGPTAGQAVS